MQPDPEYLRRHYASLSDEALLEIERADLVDVAQQLYDHEFARRGLAPVEHEPAVDVISDSVRESAAGEDQPDWLEDAAIAISYAAYPGEAEPRSASEVFDALRSAGIPCYLELVEAPKETVAAEPSGLWRVMVPGKFSFRAAGVFSKAIYNAEVEANWKAHLEALSDKELAEMNLREDFCGLFDQIERVTRVYNEELARRRGTA